MGASTSAIDDERGDFLSVIAEVAAALAEGSRLQDPAELTRARARRHFLRVVGRRASDRTRHGLPAA